MRHSLLPSRRTTTVKLPSSRIKIGMVVILTTSSFVCGCTSREPAKAPATPPPSAAAPPSQQLPQTPPPRLDAVQQAVTRVFQGAALVDSNREPNFLSGDFKSGG